MSFQLQPTTKVYVAGHRGLGGSAVMRRLEAAGCENVLTFTSGQLDLRQQGQVRAMFEQERPEAVVLAAAKVGGILANRTYPADFLYDNLMIGANVVESARQTGVRKLLNLGSSCIYPRLAPQPISEEALLTGLWKRPTAPTRSPRSRWSKCATTTESSTVATSSARCPATCTARVTTSTFRART